MNRLSAHAVLAAPLLLASQLTMAQVTRLDSFDAPGGVSELVYASEANKLVVRNAGSAIKVVNLANKQVESTQMASAKFVDMDGTASGKVLYAADYAGESSYGDPLGQHYIHRLDLASGAWTTAPTSSIAARVEAVDDQRFLLQSMDQWINFAVHQWDATNTVQMVGSGGSWVYSGPIVYDATHGRVLHSESGISSPEVSAFKLNGNVLTQQESTSRHGYLAYQLVLASDDSAVYYGNRQLDVLDVTSYRLVFPETIVAANGQYAFGAKNYYDAKTGALLGGLGGTFSSFAFSRTSTDFWAYDSLTSQLVHFNSPVPESSTLAMMVLGLVSLGALARRKR